MGFKIIRLDNGNMMVSDSNSILQYSKEGKPLAELDNPSRKTFIELGYIYPPEFLEARSSEEAVHTYLKSAGF